jgi:hypothetical protein
MPNLKTALTLHFSLGDRISRKGKDCWIKTPWKQMGRNKSLPVDFLEENVASLVVDRWSIGTV